MYTKIEGLSYRIIIYMKYIFIVIYMYYTYVCMYIKFWSIFLFIKIVKESSMIK